MSSNRPADPRWSRRRWRPRPLSAWSLRTRLVAAVIALLTVVFVAVGAVTTVALRQFLINQLDRQLTASASRAGMYLGRPEHPGAPRFPAGQPGGNTLAAVLRDGTIVRADTYSPDDAQTRQPIPSDQWQVLVDLPVNGAPRTRELGSLGWYRLVARERANGQVVIIGLPLSQVDDTVWWMVAMQSGLAGVGLLLASGVGAVIVRRSLRPLRRVADTAVQVAELPLDRGEVALSVRVPVDGDGRTEVGQVGAALNHMLEHVAAALTARQASESRVRQFVADASHELRTPLAAIRGYAELTRRSRDSVPPDIAYALSRVESESIRMGALVEDLLLLARLDAGRPLAAEPVDLSALLVNTVSDAHAAGPEHRWRLELPEEAISVRGDPARLHQVVANLLANARTHTPAGTTVTVRLSGTYEGATFTVADTGPGIPVELQPEVFERFARGDTSRSRAAGSTGLGLAIVAAVVEAHGGTVRLESRPGNTAVRVWLPSSGPSTGANGGQTKH